MQLSTKPMKFIKPFWFVFNHIGSLWLGKQILIVLITSVPTRLCSSAADWWSRTGSTGSGVCAGSEGGAPPQLAGRRLEPEKQRDTGPEPSPPGSWILPAGPPPGLLPAGAGSAWPHSAQRQAPQPGLQAGQSLGDAFSPTSDRGLDGSAGSQAGGRCRDTVGAQPREAPAGVCGCERVQRREYYAPNDDTGEYEVMWWSTSCWSVKKDLIPCKMNVITCHLLLAKEKLLIACLCDLPRPLSTLTGSKHLNCAYQCNVTLRLHHLWFKIISAKIDTYPCLQIK